MNRHNSLKKTSGPLQQYDDPMTRVDPFQQYPDVFKQIIDWSKDPMVRPENQNKYFFSDGKTYYEQICKMLKLMSVFKEAFEQIYDNEDEIHEAWDNFVDNLTATAEYGEEVGVTLTWTEESVNFDFTIPGGEDGTGIQSIVFNADYTMTITLTDGTTYTSPSLRGETGATGATGPQGPAGPQGPQGDGLHILDVYPTLADLQQAHPTGQPGDAYEVGSDPTYTLYVWSASQSAWVSAGSLGSVAPSNTNPLMDGTASPGISEYYSRGDHVHPTDTSRASQSDLNTVSGNLSTLSGQVSDIATAVDVVEDMVDDLSDIVQVSQILADQQFLYRESLADHDTIGKLDNIKGNTLVWNQLLDYTQFVPNGLMTNNNDGSVTLNGSSTSSQFIRLNDTDKIPTVLGHKYLIKGLPDGFSGGFGSVMISNDGGGLADNGGGSIGTVTTSKNLYIRVQANYVCNNLKIIPQLIDLTQLGLDSITTVNQFASLYNLPYYDFTKGKLIPFMGTSLKTVGFNQWDNEWEYGGYDNTTGAKVTTNTVIRNKNSIKVFPSTVYYAKTPEIIRLFEYDASGGYIRTTTINNGTFTLSANTYLLNWHITATSFVENSICINISSSENGKYEPYATNTLSLLTSTYFPTGMKSAGTVFDEITESNAVTRIGSVDLGSLTWVASGHDTPNEYDFWTDGIVSQVLLPANNNVVANITCARYTAKSRNQIYSGAVGIGINTTGRIFIYDTNYNTQSSSEALKQSLNGVYLYYELASPTEQSISPALDMTFKAWKGGTEQILPENTSDPYTAPIRTDMAYMSTDEAILYLKDHAVTDPTVIDDIEDLQDDVSDLQTDVGNLQTDTGNLQTDVGTLQTDVGTIQTQIGSETTTPKTGILGRLNTDESNISSMQSTVTDLDNYVSTFNTTGSVTGGIRIQSASQSVTLASGESKLVTITKALPSGYSYVGLYGFSGGDNNVLICAVQYSEINQMVYVRLKNTATYQTTVTVAVDLAFLKLYTGGN